MSILQLVYNDLFALCLIVPMMLQTGSNYHSLRLLDFGCLRMSTVCNELYWFALEYQMFVLMFVPLLLHDLHHWALGLQLGLCHYTNLHSWFQIQFAPVLAFWVCIHVARNGKNTEFEIFGNAKVAKLAFLNIFVWLKTKTHTWNHRHYNMW